MKKINIFSIIIILFYTNFTFAMEVNLIDKEKTFLFDFVLSNITSHHAEEKNQALKILLYLASIDYEPAISYLEQQTPPDNETIHNTIASMIIHILNDEIPIIELDHYQAIKKEVEKGNLKAAYCWQEMGFNMPNLFKKSQKAIDQLDPNTTD